MRATPTGPIPATVGIVLTSWRLSQPANPVAVVADTPGTGSGGLGGRGGGDARDPGTLIISINLIYPSVCLSFRLSKTHFFGLSTVPEPI